MITEVSRVCTFAQGIMVFWNITNVTGCVIKRDKYFLLLMALSKKSDLIWNKLF